MAGVWWRRYPGTELGAGEWNWHDDLRKPGSKRAPTRSRASQWSLAFTACPPRSPDDGDSRMSTPSHYATDWTITRTPGSAGGAMIGWAHHPIPVLTPADGIAIHLTRGTWRAANIGTVLKVARWGHRQSLIPMWRKITRRHPTYSSLVASHPASILSGRWFLSPPGMLPMAINGARVPSH